MHSSNRPNSHSVSRWELIDAIAKLYVIKDPCDRSPKILNKPCCRQRQSPPQKS
ncbi:hypothetical protein IQ272_24240 [Chroococcidiopsidales cyanobacterium LEGE 13417]|uniref:hypothetical protein n=1 Tax=Chroococcidiopsis sp. CCALA 051 TaxID=869949 RepID=UPI001304F012|nr:hypothetical protein [Chroococcidiopsis sp. CCALA 051]MBE9019188.1 hypothetical protein [Chroococcidiopsidales cyanobacterium LEGE 13417]